MLIDSKYITKAKEKLGTKMAFIIAEELGIEYYQVFEGYFDWEEDGSSEKALKEMKCCI